MRHIGLAVFGVVLQIVSIALAGSQIQDVSSESSLTFGEPVVWIAISLFAIALFLCLAALVTGTIRVVRAKRGGHQIRKRDLTATFVGAFGMLLIPLSLMLRSFVRP